MFRKLIRPWVLIAWLVIAAVLMLMFYFIFSQSGAVFSPPAAVTAAITIIPAQLTPTPTSTPTPQATPTVTVEAPLPPSDGEISIGGFIEIFGTEGDGLRIRSQPGTDSEVLFLGLESEVFQVIDGPQSIDGYVWWQVQAPYDETVQGWGASNYMRVIEDQ